ncbi:hypothetical protein HWV62_3200 [Athelia sp. TMB]|nr:hypothetical protein HWV62_3200 [Athelia sp. TMB]
MSLGLNRVIYEYPLNLLADSILDITTTATIGHFRLIDCVRYTRDLVLCIEEYEHVSGLGFEYSAISYVWRGNLAEQPVPPNNLGEFSVKGAEDGDPISLDVLHHACTASIIEGADRLWLDRLCIIQASRDDKSWQIARMYDIYKICKVCIILPGGINRLVSDEEETAWITRAWTLQEVTAPKRAMVLFHWERGAGEWEGWQGALKGQVTEVVPEQSAMTPLHGMLKACYYPMALTWTPENGSDICDDISPSILGSYGESSIGSLLWALEMNDPDGRATAIWQSALLRTSSRPVDMILSIMGIFGVALDARRFHKNDRIGATIALAQEILKNGGKPAWLAMSLDIPPSRFLSSFPDFPTTDVSGDIRWNSRHGPVNATVDDNIYDIDELNEVDSDEERKEGEIGSNVLLPNSWVEGIPGGTMDNDGYLNITCKATPIFSTREVLGKRRTTSARNNRDILGEDSGGATRLVGTDGKIWVIPKSGIAEGQILAAGEGHTQAFVAFLGISHKFPRDPVLQQDPRPFGGIVLPEDSPLRAFAVIEHSSGRFHRSSSFMLPEEYRNSIERWQKHSFAIGGPESFPSIGTH